MCVGNRQEKGILKTNQADYKVQRELRGTQVAVAALLGVNRVWPAGARSLKRRNHKALGRMPTLYLGALNHYIPCLLSGQAQDRTVKKPDNFTELRRRNYQKPNVCACQSVGMGVANVRV